MGHITSVRFAGPVAAALAALLLIQGCAFLKAAAEVRKKQVADALKQVRAEQDALHVAYAAGEITREQFDAKFKRLAIAEADLVGEQKRLNAPGVGWASRVQQVLAILGIAATGGGGALAVFGGPKIAMFLSRFVPFVGRMVGGVQKMASAIEESDSKAAKKILKEENHPMVQEAVKKMNGG